jgi:hypothetical protein
MVVWIFHARVGHRQGLYPKNAFPSGKAFCFRRRAIATAHHHHSPLPSPRRPGAGRDPSVVGHAASRHWVPACAGTTVGMTSFGRSPRFALRRLCARARSRGYSAKRQLHCINCDTMLLLPNHCKVRPNERNQGSLITYDASPGQLDRRIRRGEEPCSSMLRPGVSRACIGRQDC